MGAAQDLAALDIDLAAITQAGGWRSTRMPLQYAEKINAARSGMARAAPATVGGGAGAADSPLVSSSKDVKWGAAPPVLPKGAMMAVLAGDPGAAGPVAVRLKMPAGYKIPAHWHPTDEQVTVLSGTLALGMGDKLDKTKGQTLRAGGFGIAPAHMNHYAWTQTGAVIQINLMGLFALTYVNPADDPSKAAAK